MNGMSSAVLSNIVAHCCVVKSYILHTDWAGPGKAICLQSLWITSGFTYGFEAYASLF